MNHSLEKCYELLGLKPGATREELKVAYRDLARVWHPDRFTHDPDLQTRAQERLKQINEAYNSLISGRAKRVSSSQTSQTDHSCRARSTKHGSHQQVRWSMISALFCSLAQRSSSRPVDCFELGNKPRKTPHQLRCGSQQPTIRRTTLTVGSAAVQLRQKEERKRQARMNRL
jgi:DnaJ-class molecular chaperone